MTLLDRLFRRRPAPPPVPPPAQLLPALPWHSSRCACGRCVDAAGDPIVFCTRCCRELALCRCIARARA